MLHRLEHAGQRERRSDGVDEVAFAQPDLVAGDEIGGDGDEGNAEFLDADLADVLAQRIDEMTPADHAAGAHRSEEHTSELQSLMRISYAVFCLKKKQQHVIMQRFHYKP